MAAELHAVPSGVDDETPEVAEPQIIRLSSKPKQGREKRIPLFYVDDRLYTMRGQATPTLGLRYMHVARTQGPDAAADFALEALLGAEGYAALMACDDLSMDDLKAIVQRAVSIMQGPVEGPKGTSQPA